MTIEKSTSFIDPIVVHALKKKNKSRVAQSLALAIHTNFVHMPSCTQTAFGVSCLDKKVMDLLMYKINTMGTR